MGCGRTCREYKTVLIGINERKDSFNMIEQFLSTIADLARDSGIAGFFVEGGWKNIVMILISFLFMYLAIAKGFEPLLLLPISFGMLLTNLPGAEMYHSEFWVYQTVGDNDHYIDYGNILQHGGLLDKY